ncbi:MAG: hypothetical protein ACYC5M_03150 [Anaerolineae bacterium]
MTAASHSPRPLRIHRWLGALVALALMSSLSGAEANVRHAVNAQGFTFSVFLPAIYSSRISPITVNSGQRLLPPYETPTQRFGFDSGSLSGYDVAQLGAGWYTDWSASASPALPAGLAYVQTLRFKAGADKYDPDQVTIRPDAATRAMIAAKHPGSLWLLGNEPDSVFQGEPLEPAVYAEVHHRLYAEIKGLDPTALVANGGIIQATPCRLEYLDLVWAAHQAAYGTPLPVDVWNIHAFIIPEYADWGAGLPPGVNANCATYYAVRDGDSVTILRELIVAFRQWMQDKGQQAKPLIVSEYGVLYPYDPEHPDAFTDEEGQPFGPERVSQYMRASFHLFLWSADAGLGMPDDGYRLVQAWAWLSLNTHYNGALFDADKTLTLMGETYADYTANLQIRHLRLPLVLKAHP